VIAAQANGELLRDEGVLLRHLSSCQTCATTRERLQRADGAFAHAD
jgi:hypothetical protein